ncbi:hypothetical protein Hanom_Chr16g01422051 [Helianthus anomalus]
MDYHVLNSTKRKKSLFINFLPNTQNRFIAISKHNNQIIRLKTQSQTPSKSPDKHHGLPSIEQIHHLLHPDHILWAK